MKQKDFLIVGQGLAGSILAYYLIQLGLSVTIVDNNHQTSASRVAAGLIDFVSGKRLTRSWNSDLLIPFCKNFYKQVQKETNSTFLFELPSLRFFSSPDQTKFYHKRLKDSRFDNYLEKEGLPDWCYNFFNTPNSGCKINQAAVLNTPSFLDSLKTFFIKHKAYFCENFLFDDLTLSNNGINYKDTLYSKVIFCEGYKVKDNPFFKDIDFRFAKGDVFTLTIDNLANDTIYNNDKWLTPFNKEFRFGASYEWKTINCIPDEKGKQELNMHLQNWIKTPYQITNHQAGVRTAVKDIKPVIGIHPNHHSIGIFNGFSSKGVMIIPYYAEQFARFLTGLSSNLDKETSLKRLHESCCIK